MEISDKDMAIRKITEMSPEQVSKVLIFMDNMDDNKNDSCLRDIREASVEEIE